MSALRIAQIEKTFGSTRALKGVSLDIAEGEFIALVGPSGCGKSTLLRIIAGLEAQDRGSVAIGGTAVDGLRASRRNLAMVFQSYALYPHLTVAENIAVPLRMRRLNRWQRLPILGPFLPGARRRLATIGSDVLDAAQTLGIEHLLGRKPGQLSGGQRQRVAVGRALVREPRAFLLDEPLSNLDAKLRVHMRTEISELHRRLGATFIYVTHDQAEAMTMSDRIAVMMDGELLQVATPEEVYGRPADLRVAEFIGSPKINVLPVASGRDGRLHYAGRPLPFRAGADAVAGLGVRPEAFRIVRDDGQISARVVHRENFGAEVCFHLQPDGADGRLVVRAAPALLREIGLGDPVALAIDGAQVLAFDDDGRRVDLRRAGPLDREVA